MSVDEAENRMWENPRVTMSHDKFPCDNMSRVTKLRRVKNHMRKFLSLMMITHMRETLLCDANKKTAICDDNLHVKLYRVMNTRGYDNSLKMINRICIYVKPSCDGRVQYVKIPI